MSINIDKEDFREAIDLIEIAQALPIWYNLAGTSTFTYDGEYMIIANSVGAFSAIGTGHGSPSYAATHANKYLVVRATVKAVTTDTSCYFFFLEPKKADYGEFQGFKTDAGAGSHKMEFRSGGTEEEDAIAGQDWTADTVFTIRHRKGVFDHNSGVTAAIATGTAVSHGLFDDGAGLTPTSVIISAAETGPTDIFSSAVGAATFTVNFGGGGNKTFYWIAEYETTALCEGYVGGVLKASCVDDADISAEPFNVYCCEPNGVARSMTLLYPPGIHIWGI